MSTKIIYMLTTVFYPSIGGRESHIHNISKELISLGYQVKIIYPCINNKEPRVYELDQIEVHEMRIGNEKDEQKYIGYKRKSKGMLGYLSGYLRKNYYNRFASDIFNYIEEDIIKNGYVKENVMIHQHDFISGYALSKQLAKYYPQVFTNHTGEFLFLKKLPFNKPVIKHLTKHFDYVISPSEELNQFQGIRDPKTFSYMPNGVDTEQFEMPTPQQQHILRKKYDLPEDRVILLCPRRWAPTKGIIYLVQAIELLVNHYGQKKFVVAFVGNDYNDYPEYREEVMQIIKEHQLGSYVKLMGNLPYEMMSEVTKACDVVVIPSLMEAVSLSMLESMACGKIVVGSNTGGIPEVIKDEKNGYLVSKASERELAHRLNQIIENLDELTPIRQAAVETVQATYTWKIITQQVEEIYKKLWRV